MPSSSSDFNAARRRIAAAYDPAALEVAGNIVLKMVAGHFRRVESRDAKVLNWNEPAQLVVDARHWLDSPDYAGAAGSSSACRSETREEPGAPFVEAELGNRVAELARESLARGQNLHHPHYVGHQVPAPVPLAAIFELIGTITNQCMAIYEMGPWATAVEHAVIGAVGERLGFHPGKFAGLITSGGSVANLTGLLTARNVSLGNAWSAGLTGRTPAPVVVCHADSHYSVTRSAGILGLGTAQIVPAALDARRRIDAERLHGTLSDLRSRGVPVVAVSAAACATPIGAFDPLAEVAEVCRRHDVWLHVDAAHGGALAFSARHRHLLAGIHEADSVVCDAHKMMFMPALCAMLFYRDRDHRTAAFHQDAPYLFDPTAPHLTDYDSGIVNLECTKRAAAFGVWGVWSLFGPQLFGDMIEVTIELAREFYEMLKVSGDFEPLHEPQCNIVAFRYVPSELSDAPLEKIDAFQLRLRRAVVESGEFYLVQTRLDGRPVLRTTMMNPLTTQENLRGLLECLRRFGRTFL
jgi:L-2,4-diaminobutyrate decarboxylase